MGEGTALEWTQRNTIEEIEDIIDSYRDTINGLEIEIDWRAENNDK